MREKKTRKIFVLLKEAACTHLIYVYINIYIYMEEKKVLALG
jgi:hypothetical protein